MIILQCPRCDYIKYWERKANENAPQCLCNTFQAWRVLKEPPKYKPGYVRLLTSDGCYKLTGPDWQPRESNRIK